MSVTLESLASCWQGLIPAMLYTCSRDGIPNAAYLSHVDYVDSAHVALSFQFFNKSRRNIAENPHALVRVTDPDTSQGWALRLTLVRSETSGPVFERMALRIEAIASYTGLKGIFKLIAADIYEVHSIERVTDDVAGTFTREAEARQGAEADARFTMRALQNLSVRIHQAGSLEGLLDSILAGLDEIFGFHHSMILVPAEEPDVLVTIASRGYPENGIGAEARIGEGMMLYAHAVAQRARASGLCQPERIPLPGLASPESQLGVPLLVRGELVGVLCIESEEPYRFHEEDKTSIELLGSYLAIAIQNMQLIERAEGGVETTREREQRMEFTNRELRFDKSLNLPEVKDNLESRLLLLRRRLAQKCPAIRLAPRARGRFALELEGEVSLSIRP